MRRLPTNNTAKQKAIIEAVSDYYGAGITNQEKSQTTQVALFLMGRRKRIFLTAEQESDIWAIKANLPDYLIVA